jgi:acetyl esterase/lipase
MKRRLGLVAGAAAVAALAVAAAVPVLAQQAPTRAGTAAPAVPQVARPIDVEVFAQAPLISGLQLVDDGRKIIGLARVPGKTDELGVAVWDMNNLEAGPRITPPRNNIRFQGVSFLDGDRFAIFANTPWTGNIGGCGGEGEQVGSTATWIFQDYVTNFEMQEFDQPLRPRVRNDDIQRCINLSTNTSVLNRLPFEDDVVLVATLNERLESIAARYNVRTEQLTEVMSLAGSWGHGLWNGRTALPMLRERIRTESDGSNTFVTELRNPQSGQFEAQPALDNPVRERNTIDVVGFDEESGKYYVVTDRFSDLARVYMYDPITKKFDAEPAFAHPRYSATGVVLGSGREDFGRLLGFTYGAAVGEVFWVDPVRRNIQQALERALPGRQVTLSSVQDGGNRVLVRSESSRHPPAWHLLLNQRELKLLGPERIVDPNTLGETRLEFFTARDGKRVPSFVTLPAGWTPEQGRLPAIVVPHGGPWARDDAGWDFSGWVQYFASRGFAVVQPQYRGTPGFGRALWLAGDREWGKAMQDDKDDSVLDLVNRGIVDRNRIAMHGYSYGGYAAFAAAVRPNGPNAGPFRCAIAGAGVANLERIQNELFGASRIQREFQGDTVFGLDPQEQVRNTNIPLLIYTGDRDVRVPPFHSRDFYRAASAAGKNVELLMLRDMGHQGNLWFPDHFRQLLPRIESFIKNECGIQPGPIRG